MAPYPLHTNTTQTTHTISMGTHSFFLCHTYYVIDMKIPQPPTLLFLEEY